MNLYRAILSEAWAISPEHAADYLPLVLNIIKGKQPEAMQRQEVLSYAAFSTSGSSSAATQQKIAVLNVRGVLMKEDGLCSYGMESMNNYLLQIKNDASVGGLLLEMDTPGGQASYMPVLQQTLKTLGKPVVAYFNSLCASAGYGLASQAKEIYASVPTDVVGSIGTYITLMDMRPYFEKEGIKLHEIYATDSTLKNGKFREVMEGNYKPIRSQLLDPLNKQFIQSVQSMREISDEKAYQGETFMASYAVEIGMIDGIKTKEECIQRLQELIESKSISSQITQSKTNNSMSKNWKPVADLLGYEGIEAKDGHVSLSSEDMEKVANALAERDPEAAAQAAAEATNAANSELLEKITQLDAKITATSETVNAVNSSLEGFEKRLGVVEGSDGAAAASTTLPKNEGKTELDPWEDPNHPLNQSARSGF
jgi:protease-4